MAEYPGDLSVREARARYFAANNLGDGGYRDRWVKFKFGAISLWIPNTKGRVAAVRFHDLHHIVTGYDTTWKGEAEIAAWEIASGCGDYYAAWLLNLLALSIGLVIDFKSMARAFCRGQHSSNLYNEAFDEKLLAVTVGSLRKRLNLERSSYPSHRGDFARFGAWTMLSLLTSTICAFICLTPIWLALVILY